MILFGSSNARDGFVRVRARRAPLTRIANGKCQQGCSSTEQAIQCDIVAVPGSTLSRSRDMFVLEDLLGSLKKCFSSVDMVDSCVSSLLCISK